MPVLQKITFYKLKFHTICQSSKHNTHIQGIFGQIIDTIRSVFQQLELKMGCAITEPNKKVHTKTL